MGFKKNIIKISSLFLLTTFICFFIRDNGDLAGSEIKQAKKYTFEDLSKAYHMVLEADIAIKTGRYDDDLAINLLVAELASS